MPQGLRTSLRAGWSPRPQNHANVMAPLKLAVLYEICDDNLSA